MKKSKIIVGVLAIAMSATTAYGQSFTYMTKDTASTQLGGTGASGMEGMGGHVEGQVEFKYADGDKAKGAYECVSMVSPKDSKLFDVHMACDVTMKDGNFALIVGCTIMNPEGAVTSCVGGMKGKTGSYEDKYGNFSQHSKDGKATGSGQWFE